MRGGTVRRALSALAAVAVLTLTSCYAPDNFTSELRLSRYGDYDLTFDGDLLYLPILYDYQQGKVDPADEARRLNEIRKDLIRDSAVKSAVSEGKGRFRVHYERMGRMGRDQLTAILRRDARILMIKSEPDNRIIISANSLRPTDADAMTEAGYTMHGSFRITTDANVVSNNATEVRPFGQYKVYIWNIENALSPMPYLVMIRDPDPERPLP